MLWLGAAADAAGTDMPISEKDLEDLIAELLRQIEKFWDSLSPEQKRELEAAYIALGQALNALKTGGLAAARGNLLAVLEKLRELIAGIIRLGGSGPLYVRLQILTNWIQKYLAALGGETAGATAGGSISFGPVMITGITTATVAILLIELIAIFVGLYLWYDYCEKQAGTAPLPFGGRPCGNGKPVASGLKEWVVSYGGVRSWNHLMENVRKTAASYSCPGNCATGKCTGVPAIIDTDQTSLVFLSYCSCTFDVYCECV